MGLNFDDIVDCKLIQTTNPKIKKRMDQETIGDKI